MRDRRRSRRPARWLDCSCSPQPPSSLFAPYKAVRGVTDKTHGGYRLDGSGLEPRSRQEIFCSVHPFRPARGPTQPVQCVQGVKRPGRGVHHPPHLAPRLQMSGAIPLLPLCLHGRSLRYAQSTSFSFTHVCVLFLLDFRGSLQRQKGFMW